MRSPPWSSRTSTKNPRMPEELVGVAAAPGVVAGPIKKMGEPECRQLASLALDLTNPGEARTAVAEATKLP